MWCDGLYEEKFRMHVQAHMVLALIPAEDLNGADDRRKLIRFGMQVRFFGIPTLAHTATFGIPVFRHFGLHPPHQRSLHCSIMLHCGMLQSRSVLHATKSSTPAHAAKSHAAM